MQRVVITGMGIYSCIGLDVGSVRTSLKEGKSGIIYDAERMDFGFRSGLTGMVELPNLKGKIGRRQRVGLADMGMFAYVATEEALEMAKVDDEFFEENEVGILYGNDSSAKAVIDSIDAVRIKKDTALLGSGAILQGMNSTVTMNLATLYKVTGINFTISGACASGSHALGLAYFLIRSGLQSHIICGGAQEINKYVMASFDGLSAFSARNDSPQKASRPFDKDRDGLVPSGGAATLFVESYESAVKRGATILAEVVGYGFSSNGAHITKPSVVGAHTSLERSLKDAKLDPSEIDYINAHATSTPLGDACEAEAIDKVFHGCKTPVSSTKSMTGHECWMAGASEIVYSILMMQDGFIAPNINFEAPDEQTAKLNVVSAPTEKELKCVLSNSFGFGGTNSTIILKKM